LTVPSRVFYFLCNWAVKHSLLLLYSTLTIDYWPRISIKIMHCVAAAFGVTCITFTLVQCIPRHEHMWDEIATDPYWFYSSDCINMNAFNYFNSIFMLVNDTILYAMPLVFTWRLNVSRPQRIAVNLLFALGGLVLAASGTRIYFVAQQAKFQEFTYRFAMTMLCAVIEKVRKTHHSTLQRPMLTFHSMCSLQLHFLNIHSLPPPSNIDKYRGTLTHTLRSYANHFCPQPPRHNRRLRPFHQSHPPPHLSLPRNQIRKASQ
jgi:hypothetical protein